MGISDFVRSELIEVIEWTDNTRDTLTHRFDDGDRTIKNGAQLIVRESQLAQFVYLGKFGDTFGPGQHALVTGNIPVLTTLSSWKYGFNSPFKADVYFVNVRLFTGNKWGTTHPIMVHDDALGIVRLRSFGTFDFRIADAKIFLREVAGSDRDFRLDEFLETMQSRLVSLFADALATARLKLEDLAARYRELGEALLPVVNGVMTSQYGVSITSFAIENISVPPEVEEAIDKRGSMSEIGDLNDYVKFQIAQGMAKGGSSGGMATELAVGLSVAQQVLGKPAGSGSLLASGATGDAGLPELLSPADAAKALGVPESDVMKVIESGELSSKKIGDSYRITRQALQQYIGT
jgi:excisionase family DNA binding protein